MNNFFNQLLLMSFEVNLKIHEISKSNKHGTVEHQ